MSKIILFILCLFFVFEAQSQDQVLNKVAGVNILKKTDILIDTSNDSFFRLKGSGKFPPTLFVIDGILYENFDSSIVHPNNILSIDILKESSLHIIGCRPRSGGVILITTRKADERTISVKDFVTDEPLEGAYVEMISKNRMTDTIRLITDKSGNITTQKIIAGEEYEMNISYVGYRSFKTNVNAKLIGKNYTVLLSKNFAMMPEVVIVSYPTIRCGRGCGHCVVVTKGVNYLKKEIDLPFVKVYPNPVIRSGNVNLEFNSEKQSKLTIQLYSIGNSLISRREYVVNKGNNKLSFSIDPRLSAGIYFLQAIDENGKLIRTEKLVIQ